MNKNSLAYTIVFGFVSIFLFVVPLSVAHNLTKETVERNSELARQRSVLASFGLLPVSGDLSGDEVRDLYAQVKLSEVKGRRVYSYSDAAQTYYASEFTAPGLWGPITAVVSFYPDLSRVKSFSVLRHSETPGLGARITEAWFLEQFKDERFQEDGVIAVNAAPKDRRDKEDGAVDAITGATRTSDAMAQLFREARVAMISIKGDLP